MAPNVRFFNQSFPRRGGYIEEAQLAMYGVEIFRDIHGHDNIPKDFQVSLDDDRYPDLLRGFHLGMKVIQYKVLDPPQPPKTSSKKI